MPVVELICPLDIDPKTGTMFRVDPSSCFLEQIESVPEPLAPQPQIVENGNFLLSNFDTEKGPLVDELDKPDPFAQLELLAKVKRSFNCNSKDPRFCHNHGCCWVSPAGALDAGWHYKLDFTLQVRLAKILVRH